MKLKRFFISPINKGEVLIEPPESQHLAKVLRLRPGQVVELFDGHGALAQARIEKASAGKVILSVTHIEIFQPPQQAEIILAVSMAKGERFDRLVTQVTELGVDRICPVLFERTVKQARNPQMSRRWQRLAIAAAKQCGRLFLPRIDLPATLPVKLQELSTDYPHHRILWGSLNQHCPSLIEQQFGTEPVIVLIGPEGGLTEAEETILQNRDAQPIRLTNTILRVETAAEACAAILCTQREMHRMHTSQA